jgi:hypothetical protein
MLFEKVHEGTHCKCLNDDAVTENLTDTFARRVKHTPPIVDDFLSYHEEGQKSKRADRDNCDVICKLRGVTTYKIDATNEASLKARWVDTVRIKPRASSLYCKFRFATGAGKVKHTPSHNDELHHTFFKSDDFVITHLIILEISLLV